MSQNKVQDWDFEKFPIDLKKYKPFPLDPTKDKKLTQEQKDGLIANISLLRDVVVFFTATGAARGLAGHTGGAFDTIPEVVILLSFLLGDTDKSKYVDILFDEAGHRVATQYLLSVLDGQLPVEQLLHYREAYSHLPGHPELGFTPGVKFSSGRLGHMWPLVNGVALAEKDKTVFMLGSDGSQQEGDDAEAARLAVAQNLNVKLFIDDNDVTIAGHPSEYLKGYTVAKTLEGHGLKVVEANGEDLDSLYPAIVEILNYNGPAAVVVHRPMAPKIKGIEGSSHAHDAIKVEPAIEYLDPRHPKCANILRAIQPSTYSDILLGSTKEKGACRVEFGEAVSRVLDKTSKDENKSKVLVVDSDLEGSTGLNVIHKKHPEVFLSSGIMERGNFSAAAGWGAFKADRYGVFSTFSAFSEMIISELTMARLNFANVLTHFSHSGVDEMADNTCHFGINNFFLDNGLEDAYETRLYFPADCSQMDTIIDKVFYEKGLRFVFSTRSKVPWILKEDGSRFFEDSSYKFVPGKDEIIRKGTKGYVVSYGDILHRALDAVDRLRKEGLDIGLINKSTLNVVDEDVIKEIGKTEFVLVAESLNQKTGLGSKLGTWLLERDLRPRYGYMGTNKEGCGGLGEQIGHQGLDSASIALKIKQLIK
ncbi:transketolase [Kwoniella mangroviensis CBS 10435]|uniref:Transketolase n=1 Tax=Kwoniella mangroviensis CBS 10435 TaxID=1331196 RepID=A0A1B9IP75_9TREE|nr:transketolase [Kwoniella mangroviensis CBS 8507]OCF57180.1 transketolase [Kwoniella mangroviensis CBS 10435]OCF70486.1 transketolase [Kwoniella mangroviensis CBS 8507]